MEDTTAAVPNIASLSLQAQKPATLTNLPSELLIRILAEPTLRTRELFRTLTTCKLLSAVAHPLLYGRIHLHSPRQATDLVNYLLDEAHATARGKVRELSFQLGHWKEFDDEEIVFHTCSAYHLLKLVGPSLISLTDPPVFWDYEDKMLDAIQQIPNLQQLSLWNAPIDEEQPFHRLVTCDLESLLENASITALSLERFELIHPIAISGRICSLELYRCDMTCGQLKMLLDSSPALERLLLRNCTFINAYEFYSMASSLRDLKTLELIDMFKFPEASPSLERIPHRFLQDFSQLEALHISGNIISPMALLYLPPRLQSLALVRTPRLDSGWFGIALHHLKRRMEIKVVGMKWPKEQEEFLINVADRYGTKLSFR